LAEDVFPDADRNLIYAGADQMKLNEVQQIRWDTLKW